MHAINCVFDTRALRNLFREGLVEPDWLPLLRPCDNARRKCATNQNVEAVGTIVLHVQIGHGGVRVTFGIV